MIFFDVGCDRSLVVRDHASKQPGIRSAITHPAVDDGGDNRYLFFSL